MHKVQKYFIQGFRVQISNSRWVQSDIFFRTMGHSPQITGVDCYNQDMTYLGFIYPENLSLTLKKDILRYIRENKKRWQRVFTATDYRG